MALQSSADNQTSSPGIQISKPKQSSFLLIIGALGLLAVIGFSIYLNLQKQVIVDAQQKIQEENTKLTQEVKTLQSSKTQATQLAQQWLTTVEQNEILWSRVLGRLQSLIPFDAATKKQKITFVSYIGSTGGVLSLSAQTRTATDAPYEDVSELLKSLNESSYFSHAVVPTITRGETDSGEKFLTFTLNVRYEEQPLPELETPAMDSTNTTVNNGGNVEGGATETNTNRSPKPSPNTSTIGTPRPGTQNTP